MPTRTSNTSHITEVASVVEDVPYTIQVPKEALNALLLGQKWRGEVSIGPKRVRSSNRAGAIQKQAGEKKHFRATVRATVEERKIIRAWNRSRYIQAQERSAERELRNHPLPFNKIKEALPIVRKALKAVGLVGVIREIETYFDFCTNGGHIWDGGNHGYKTVTGFLEKLLKVHKAKEKPWWDTKELPARKVTDEHKALTNRIANSFAQNFMDEDKFPLEEGSKEHRFFIKTSSQIVTYISRKKRQGIELTQTELIRYLFEFVMDLFDKSNEVVYPSHLASSAIWSAFPQHLQEKGVI